MSSAVNGLPSLHFTPERGVTVSCVKSEFHCTFEASHGVVWFLPTGFTIASGSKIIRL
ncbi:hypothetical protein P9139_04655 [Curtobacterium flaccumfaciens]|nr:hypothetical protein P9139_04655 [Curtobacterium flaccumfaciens]